MITGSGFVAGSTQVTLDSLPVTVLSVSTTRVVAICPSEPVRSPVIHVLVEGAGSASMAVTYARSAPGIFSFETATAGASGPLNHDGSQNLAVSPATPGSALSVWVTGLGRLAAGTGARRPTPDEPVKVTIGGGQAVVNAIAEVGNGIFRVDVQVPAGLPGALQAMIVSQSGFNSPPQYIFLPPDAPVNTNFYLARVGAIDLAYDPFRHVLWASTASNAPVSDPQNPPPAQPDSILMLDPVSHAVILAIPIGTSAYNIALSKTGRYLWLGTSDGAVKRLNLVTQQVEFSLDLNKLVADAALYLAPVTNAAIALIAPSPEDEEVAVITISNLANAPYPLLALRGSKLLQNVGPQDTRVLFNSDGTFWTEKHLVELTPNGPHVLAEAAPSSGGPAPVMVNANGDLFDYNGFLRRSSDLAITGFLDGSPDYCTGTIGPAGSLFLPETGLIYMNAGISGGTNYAIQSFDPVTMLPVGQFYFPDFKASQSDIPNQGPPCRLVSSGSEGFATVFSSPSPNGNGGTIWFTPRALVQPLDSFPIPPAQPPTGSQRQFALPVEYATVDSQSGIVYFTLSGGLVGIGNSVIAFDPAKGSFGKPVWVGSEPRVGLVSNDQQYLYLSFAGRFAVQRFLYPSLTPDIELPLYSENGYPVDASAIMSVPNSPSSTVAIPRVSTTSAADAGVAVYDNGIKRPQTTWLTQLHPYTDSVQFSPAGDYLFAINNQDSGFQFSRWSLGPSGFTLDAQQSGLFYGYGATLTCFPATIEQCAISYGQLIDPYALTSVGTFAGNFTSASSIAADVAHDRIYYLDEQSQIGVYALSTQQLVGRVIPNLGEDIGLQMQLLPSGELLLIGLRGFYLVPATPSQ